MMMQTKGGHQASRGDEYEMHMDSSFKAIDSKSTVVRQFKNVPSNPSESDFYGPYNKLLHLLFPADSDFVVSFQYTPDAQNLLDLGLTYEIRFVDKSVLLLQVRRPSHREILSKRQAADDHIRRHMADIVGEA
ncbi:hypothetical protein OE88DRAFT_1647007 [Heliocybe sulcata]|uniref:Uncharacterized protein n=1 Tax=Heliocybe sulcata TaxID=5364 RepID=A0A5C3N3P2_9AGAM|nr:hypothetical protein OE88DRAFT_1647007 [Heliocybe sulcata]